MEQRRTRKPKLEFSKIISITMLVVFVLSFVVAWGVYIFQDKISTELLNFISIPLQTVMGFYFTKATFENVTKIKQDDK